jgi:hypothetical protein
VIVSIDECPAIGIRAGQDVVLVAAGRRPHPRNLVTLCIENGRALDVVAVARLVAVQIVDGAGDQLALDVVPGAGADAIACTDTRRGAALFLAEIGVPSARGGSPAYCLGLALANLVGAREPAKIAGAVRVLGNEEAREVGLHLRLLLLGLRQHSRRRS